jgi:micrococcal nuclease
MTNRQAKPERWYAIAYLLWCAIAGYGQLVPHSLHPPQAMTSATVTRVVSGQTIEVRLDSPFDPQSDRPADHRGNPIETIRLSGIDAPDLRQSPWGLASQQALATRIEGRRIELEWESVDELGEPERDRFDRLHASVWLEGELMQAELLRSGWGLVQDSPMGRESSHVSTLRNAEAEARSLDRGLWSAASALRQHPAEFRSEL